MRANRNTITLKQNIRYISIIISILIYGKQMAIMWILIFLVMGNIRKLSQKNNFVETIRLIGYFLIYLIPLCFEHKEIKLLGNDNLDICLITSLSIGFGIFVFDYCKNKIMYSKEMIARMTYSTKYYIVLIIINALGAAVCEEIFFRGYLLGRDNLNIIQFLASSVFFVLSHYLLLWASAFTYKDYLRQFCVGIISGALFIYSGSIIPSICLHILCNGNRILMEIRRYDRFYINRKKYDSIKQNDSDIDIDF